MRPLFQPHPVAIVLVAALVASADAAVFHVDRTDDEATATACDPGVADDCSLRGAILAANALAPAASEIVVPAGSYVLDTATSCTYVHPSNGPTTADRVELCAMASVKITGAGAATTIIDPEERDRVLYVKSGVEVEVSGVTLRNGNIGVLAGGAGGAIDNEGTLRVADAVISDNFAASSGGGINNAGTLVVERTLIVENQANAAAAIWQPAGGSMTIVDTVVRDNFATFSAGGIWTYDSDVVIHRSLVHRNAAFGTAGGLMVNAYEPGHATVITNSTVSGNEAGGDGGGIYAVGSHVDLRLRSVTITDNAAGLESPDTGKGGGLYFAKTGTVTLRNTIVAGNSCHHQDGLACNCAFSGSELGPFLVSEGYNLIGNTSFCRVTGVTTGNLLDVDAKLAPLAENGGPTATHGFLSGSPALDAGNPAGCTDDDGAVLSEDQRGSPRAADGDGNGTARCDIGAFELGGGGQGGGPTVDRIQPREGGNAAPVIVIVHGSGFAPGATVRLARSGEADVVASPVNVAENGQALVATLDLAGRPIGLWDVVVANPGAASTTQAGAFTIAAAAAPEVWVDLVGPDVVRGGRPARYVVLYGNRGNTDAFAVPLVVSVPEKFGLRPRFEITPPPQQPGKTVMQEWGRFYQQRIGGEPPMREVVLLLPVVPAGFSGALEMGIDVPFGFGRDFRVKIERGDPLVDHDGPRADEIAALVAGARGRADSLFKFALPTAIDDDLTDYLETQLATIVESGRAALVASVGTDPGVYALLQLSYDLTVFGMVWTNLTVPPVAAREVPLLERLADLAATCLVSEASAQSRCCCGPCRAGLGCCNGCICSNDPKTPDPDPPDECLAPDGKCEPPFTEDDCVAMGFEVVPDFDLEGNSTMICANDRRCARPTAFDRSQCDWREIDIRAAHDPNDKSGPSGGGASHFIPSDTPLAYTIRFENKPEATAPAADVVITDQLDASQLDLATLALGPLGFGDHTVTPPPGLTAFTSDVDLRPETNLSVRVEAELDPATAILTWRFTSLDPLTGEPPEDPLAGFLPPNVTPPEGDGYVSFTVGAKPAVTTGAQISNQARIVFDANPPIDTPVWTNNVDDTPPVSQVTSAVSVGACSRDVLVSWSGSDQGSSVATYTIAASEDGGPFTAAITSSAATGVFHGKWGETYLFRSVATDEAGNVQTEPSAPGGQVMVPDCGPHDLAVIGMKMPAKVKLTRTRPTAKRLAKVTIQNRGVTPLVIDDAATLRELVTLAVEPLGSCAPATVTLLEKKPQKPFPIVVASKKKLNVAFDVLFECIHDAASGKGHEDYRLVAEVHQSAVGGDDAHPLDDVCPRAVSPPVVDPYPNGKITEKGCGGKGENGLGGPVLVDLTVGR